MEGRRARAQRKGGNPARNGRKEGQGSAQRKGGNPARARDLIKRGNLGQEWRTMDRRKETLARNGGPWIEGRKPWPGFEGRVNILAEIRGSDEDCKEEQVEL